MQKPLVNITNFNLNYGSKTILSGLNWTIEKGEHWLLCGESGTGKSALLKAIARIDKWSDDIVVCMDKKSRINPLVQYVAQWYRFKNIEGADNFYYQQRYNKQQTKDTLSVKAELSYFAKENHLAEEKLKPLLSVFNYEQLLENQLIELSSGEHKKLQLIKALWLRPQLLLLDQPYTGLDSQSHRNLNDILDDLAAEGITIVLVSNEEEIPTCINRFANINQQKINELFTFCSKPTNKIVQQQVPAILATPPVTSQETLVKLVDINIHYDEKLVLKHVNWEVKVGEKWLLQGPNGSGKSTLLSIINADHPQSYANEIYLFGNRRGTGESIWDIKKNIGLISPELHWYFDFNATVFQSIASGYFDSIGLYKEISYTKRKEIEELIAYFDLIAYKDEPLGHLPLGKQRLALLARTMIKNPLLLVLDEPCQGLDSYQTLQFNTLIDGLCDEHRTIIYVSHDKEHLPKKLTHQLNLDKGEVVATSELLKEIELI